MSGGALGATLLFGGVVGVLSGLVGVGGGVIMVPFLYLLFAAPGWSGVVVDAASQALVAHATSLFVIIPTAIAAVMGYRGSDRVVWPVVVPMALGAIVAAAGGAMVAERLAPEALKGAFGALLVAVGVRLLRERREASTGPRRPVRLHPAVTVPCGMVAGFFSALLGVGGGIVAIPLLIYVIHLDLRDVAATSIGLVVFASVAGSAAYVVLGLDAPSLPSGTLGYVFFPAGLALVPGAVAGAVWGARLNQKMTGRGLRILFAVVFLVLGLRLFVPNVAALLGIRSEAPAGLARGHRA